MKAMKQMKALKSRVGVAAPFVPASAEDVSRAFLSAVPGDFVLWRWRPVPGEEEEEEAEEVSAENDDDEHSEDDTNPAVWLGVVVGGAGSRYLAEVLWEPQLSTCLSAPYRSGVRLRTGFEYEVPLVSKPPGRLLLSPVKPVKKHRTEPLVAPQAHFLIEDTVPSVPQQQQPPVSQFEDTAPSAPQQQQPPVVQYEDVPHHTTEPLTHQPSWFPTAPPATHWYPPSATPAPLHHWHPQQPATLAPPYQQYPPPPAPQAPTEKKTFRHVTHDIAFPTSHPLERAVIALAPLYWVETQARESRSIVEHGYTFALLQLKAAIPGLTPTSASLIDAGGEIVLCSLPCVCSVEGTSPPPKHGSTCCGAPCSWRPRRRWRKAAPRGIMHLPRRPPPHGRGRNMILLQCTEKSLFAPPTHTTTNPQLCPLPSPLHQRNQAKVPKLTTTTATGVTDWRTPHTQTQHETLITQHPTNLTLTIKQQQQQQQRPRTVDQGEQLNWPQASTKTRTRFDELITTTAQGFKTEGWIRLCRRFPLPCRNVGHGTVCMDAPGQGNTQVAVFHNSNILGCTHVQLEAPPRPLRRRRLEDRGPFRKASSGRAHTLPRNNARGGPASPSTTALSHTYRTRRDSSNLRRFHNRRENQRRSTTPSGRRDTNRSFPSPHIQTRQNSSLHTTLYGAPRHTTRGLPTPGPLRVEPETGRPTLPRLHTRRPAEHSTGAPAVATNAQPRTTFSTEGRPHNDGTTRCPTGGHPSPILASLDRRYAETLPPRRCSGPCRSSTHSPDLTDGNARDTTAIPQPVSSENTDGKRLHPNMLSHIWPMKNRTHASHNELQLPLHAKPTLQRTLDEKLKQIQTIEILTDSDNRLSMRFAKILQILENLPTTFVNPRDARHCTPELSAEDPEALLKGGIVDEETHLNAQTTAELPRPLSSDLRPFTTPEKEPPVRRRFVAHTPHTNEMFDELLTDDMELPSPQECASDAMYAHAATVDVKACFHGFVLPHRLRYWRFTHRGKTYRLRTIPTGASWCPLLAQTFGLALAQLLQYIIPTIKVRVYIDNFRFSANDIHVVEAAVLQFYRICNHFGVSLNEDCEETLNMIKTQHYDFLGITYNHQLHTTQLTQKLRTKITRLASLNEPEVASLTFRQLLSMYGLLNHASSITGSPRAKWYYLLKFLRRSASRKVQLNAQADIWPSLRGQIQTWAAEELARPPVVHSHLHREISATVYTDASNSGWGIVVFRDDGPTTIRGGTWKISESPLHINLKETITVLFALDLLSEKHFRPLTHVSLLVDNTSAIAAVEKGTSRSYELNQLAWLITLHEKRPLINNIHYVQSAKNHADWVSRVPEWAWPQVQTTHTSTTSIQYNNIRRRALTLMALGTAETEKSTTVSETPDKKLTHML
ncbi:unnamed protein product [Bodo saltans]|uniref:Reverse transcriptase domain-containing protein n=1 Tax=Bodo saltans TaxID=75058 RepID=A0A0S4IQC4_BODSA|nr:unnamed protein product [Bodo saltans]|eukprot:CUE61285.1 unnamed protein product [Bodo saltans]